MLLDCAISSKIATEGEGRGLGRRRSIFLALVERTCPGFKQEAGIDGVDM